MRRRRRGFTLIEMLMVVTIIGVLSSIAVPKYRAVKRRALATQIVGDVDVVRLATMSFFVDSSYFPDEEDAGDVPPGLRPYLPNNFRFKKPEWTLDYENWTSSKRSRKTGVVIGVSFTTRDRELGRTAISLFGNNPKFTIGSRYTVVISGL